MAISFLLQKDKVATLTASLPDTAIYKRNYIRKKIKNMVFFTKVWGLMAP